MTPAEEIGHLANVPIELEIQLDRKLVPVREILDWDEGTVVWLTRSAGENIDVYGGGALLGFGEIVVVENTFAVRLTDFRQED